MSNSDNPLQIIEAASPAPVKEAKPRGIRVDVRVDSNRTIAIYTGRRVADALAVVTSEMTLIRAVKLTQVIEAVYEQGKKDGARSVFDSIDCLKASIPHRNPGKPKKQQKRSKR